MQTKMHKTTMKALALAVMTVYSSHAVADNVAGKSSWVSAKEDVTKDSVSYTEYYKWTFSTEKKADGTDIGSDVITKAESLTAAKASKDFGEFKDNTGKSIAKADDAAYKKTCSQGDCKPGIDADGWRRDKYGKKVPIPNDADEHKGTNLDAGGNPWHNLGSGKKDTDAANIGDVTKRVNEATAGQNEAITKNTSDIKTLTSRTTDLEKKTQELDTKVEHLKSDLRHVDKRASRGIASAMASAGLDLYSQPGEYAIAVGTATYRGEGALAFGVSMRGADGHWGTNASVNLNNDDVGATISVGYHW